MINMLLTLSTVIFGGPISSKDIYDIKRIGIKNIELNYNYYLDEKMLQRLCMEGVNIISAHAPFFGCDISSEIYAERKDAISQVKALIDQIKKYSSEYLIIHPGIWSEGKDRDKLLKNTIESLTFISDHAGKNNIKVCIENMPPGFLGDNLYELEYILEKVRENTFCSDRIGVCLDTGHAYLKNCLMDYLEYFSNDIEYMHIHDNFGDMNGSREKVADDLHNPPGIGNIDWEEFFKTLMRKSYRSPICFEIKNKVSQEGEDALSLIESFISKMTIEEMEPNG
jgi:sugar phosphate isomerase/epimerase